MTKPKVKRARRAGRGNIRKQKCPQCNKRRILKMHTCKGKKKYYNQLI